MTKELLEKSMRLSKEILEHYTKDGYDLIKRFITLEQEISEELKKDITSDQSLSITPKKPPHEETKEPPKENKKIEIPEIDDLPF